MYKHSYQKGFLTVLFSGGANSLGHWEQKVKNGYIRRIIDDDVKGLVIEVMGSNVETTYITCPADPKMSLGIALPFLVMIVKNMKKYFSFEIQVKDDQNLARRFRASNYQSATRVREFCTSMPISLKGDWSRIQLNIADFTKRAYGSGYVESMRLTIHANIRIRRIYFTDRLYTEDELPDEYKIYPSVKPVPRKKSMLYATQKGKDKKAAKKVPSNTAIPAGAPPTPVEAASRIDIENPQKAPTEAEKQ